MNEQVLRESLDGYIRRIKEQKYDAAVCVMTDIHSEDLTPFAVMNDLACSGVADVCISLGDVIASRYDSKAQAVELLEKAAHIFRQGEPKAAIYMVRGNHDVNPVEDFDVTKMVGNAEYLHLSGNDRQPGMVGTGHNYGIHDLDKAKVRLIILDTSDIFDEDGQRLSTNNEVMIQQEQFDWFCHRALDLSDKENPEEWAVLVLGHSSMEKHCPDAFRTVLDAFAAGSKAEGDFPYDSAGYAYTLHLNADFSRQGPGRFICSVSGHEHRDSVNHLGQHREVYTICYSEGCYHYDEAGNWVWYVRQPGTAEEHCVDTILLDRVNQTARFLRFGVGEDREICWSE